MPTTTPTDPYGRAVTMTADGDHVRLTITDADGTTLAVRVPADYPDHLTTALLRAHRPRFRLDQARETKLANLTDLLRTRLAAGVTITHAGNTYLIDLDPAELADLAAAVADAHAAVAANDNTYRYDLTALRNDAPATLTLNAAQLLTLARLIRRDRRAILADHRARVAAVLAAQDETQLRNA